MANKHMKMYSTSYVNIEFQSKTMRYYNIAIREAKTKAQMTPNADKNEEQKRLSFIVHGNANMVHEF